MTDLLNAVPWIGVVMKDRSHKTLALADVLAAAPHAARVDTGWPAGDIAVFRILTACVAAAARNAGVDLDDDRPDLSPEALRAVDPYLSPRAAAFDLTTGATWQHPDADPDGAVDPVHQLDLRRNRKSSLVRDDAAHAFTRPVLDDAQAALCIAVQNCLGFGGLGTGALARGSDKPCKVRHYKAGPAAMILQIHPDTGSLSRDLKASAAAALRLSDPDDTPTWDRDPPPLEPRVVHPGTLELLTLPGRRVVMAGRPGAWDGCRISPGDSLADAEKAYLRDPFSAHVTDAEAAEGAQLSRKKNRIKTDVYRAGYSLADAPGENTGAVGPLAPAATPLSDAAREALRLAPRDADGHAAIRVRILGCALEPGKAVSARHHDDTAVYSTDPRRRELLENLIEEAQKDEGISTATRRRAAFLARVPLAG